eukprot:7395680-Alexandrium_andersonii.AAC.1
MWAGPAFLHPLRQSANAIASAHKHKLTHLPRTQNADKRARGSSGHRRHTGKAACLQGTPDDQRIAHEATDASNARRPTQ